jgi:hypothetical protein
VPEVYVDRVDLDPLCPTPVLFDALIAEDECGLVFVKALSADEPGVSLQRVSPNWPHHLPGDVAIALTGQAGIIAMHRRGLIGPTWRGHGVRIQDARYSAPVLVGERFFTRVDIVRAPLAKACVRFRFRMWRRAAGGDRDLPQPSGCNVLRARVDSSRGALDTPVLSTVEGRPNPSIRASRYSGGRYSG